MASTNSPRYDALTKKKSRKIPKVDALYAGWYRAPNNKLYFGRGRVVEIGTTHDGSAYINVHPRHNQPGSKWDFFDPATDADMPRDQYPPDRAAREAFSDRDAAKKKSMRRRFPSPPRWFQRFSRDPKRPTNWRHHDLVEFSRHKKDLKPGDTAYGLYRSARNLRYYGPGRVVGPLPKRRIKPKPNAANADGNEDDDDDENENVDMDIDMDKDEDEDEEEYEDEDELVCYHIEPSRVRGVLPVWESSTRKDIEVQDLPRSTYSGSQATQSQGQRDVDAGRPRRKESPKYYKWKGGLPRMPYDKSEHPRLGTEHSGVYFRADGQLFVGVGKVVGVGFTWRLTEMKTWYVFVEPFQEKLGAGGNYDFSHPVTHEWMDTLPSNPIPGVSCTPKQRRALPPRWRDLPSISHMEPALGEESAGRFYPPKAPRWNVYIGVGTVVKTGTDSNNKIWVEVKPITGKTSNPLYRFFDPWTGLDMPEDYYP